MRNTDKIIIGLVMKSLNAEFFKSMQKGAEQFSASHDEYRLISVGTDSQTEIEEQISLIDKLVDDGVDALVVVPIDSKALVVPVVRAVKKGVIVVNIDIKLDEDMLLAAGVNLTYVGPDNFTASYELGRRLSSDLKSGDKVIMIEGLPVAENAKERKAGFLRAIDERGLILAASEPADWETRKAADVFRTLYNENADIRAVFCCNDAMALGVIDVLKSCGKEPGAVKVIGFDNDDVMKPLMDNGWFYGTVDAFGSQMAVEGIKQVLKVINGLQAGRIYSTPYEIIL